MQIPMCALCALVPCTVQLLMHSHRWLVWVKRCEGRRSHDVFSRHLVCCRGLRTTHTCHERAQHLEVAHTTTHRTDPWPDTGNGVVVSRPLSTREALGSVPSVTMFTGAGRAGSRHTHPSAKPDHEHYPTHRQAIQKNTQLHNIKIFIYTHIVYTHTYTECDLGPHHSASLYIEYAPNG